MQIDQANGVYYRDGPINFGLKSSQNCGSHVKATNKVVIVACPAKGVIEVINTLNMETIYVTPSKSRQTF